MFKFILIALIFVLYSCSTAKVTVPDKFKSQATRHKVKGVDGWQVNQHLEFGPYSTSRIKRGWDFASSVRYTKFRINPEEEILRVFDINTENSKSNQRSKFQYTIRHTDEDAEIFATEKFNESQLVYRSNNPFIGTVSRSNRYEYAFAATIIPFRPGSKPWSLVLINKYDASRDTARKLFDRPYVEEEGYATDGTETIAIRPLRIDKTTTRSGKDIKIFGGKMFAGYELQWDGGVVGVIDILDKSVWFYNDLPADEKLILASISSAILLKRMQGENDI
jgi:hypothetical protein